ncbi:response regulator [Asticcacaulis sp.]|uniref:response regulator n=1 Tax=Asticcacaulis sp. TaxID=1872648 RepID=UPI002CD92BE5|nr:response regulator [Asticcacaulis sp.]HTM82531.1 response regulator [Asticcacaulis sp.]
MRTDALTDPLPSERLATVLLIDDRKADVELARVFLQVRDKMQFNLKVANGAKQAMEMLKQAVTRGEIVDLLLLDINMPGMDGFELLEEIRKDEALRPIAVVMCTGSTYDQDQARAHALGAAGYMVKPASLAQLRPMLTSIPALKLDPDGENVRLMRAA